MLSLLASLVLVTQQKSQVAQLFTHLKTSVVRIYVGDTETTVHYAGTGWTYRDPQTIVTAKHVLQEDLTDTPYEHAYVQYADGKLDPVLTQKDGEDDVAVVGVRERMQTAVTNRLADRAPSVGDPVFKLGFPGGFEDAFVPLPTIGILSQLEVWFQGAKIANRVGHTATINPGDSGSPLYDLEGNVVGMNVEAIPGMVSMNFAISLGQLRKELDKLVN